MAEAAAQGGAGWRGRLEQWMGGGATDAAVLLDPGALFPRGRWLVPDKGCCCSGMCCGGRPEPTCCCGPPIRAAAYGVCVTLIVFKAVRVASAPPPPPSAVSPSTCPPLLLASHSAQIYVAFLAWLLPMSLWAQASLGGFEWVAPMIIGDLVWCVSETAQTTACPKLLKWPPVENGSNGHPSRTAHAEAGPRRSVYVAVIACLGLCLVGIGNTRAAPCPTEST
jgi:hypothetical protein